MGRGYGGHESPLEEGGYVGMGKGRLSHSRVPPPTILRTLRTASASSPLLKTQLYTFCPCSPPDPLTS